MNLNLRLMCRDCQDPVPHIVEDFAAGDLICGTCGLILGNRVIDTRSEWRNFASNDDGAKDSSRVGASSDPLLEGELDSTIISKMDGGSGASFNLSKTQVKVVGKAQKNLLNAFKQIDLMCDGIGLSRIVKDSAKQFFKKVDEEKLLRGKGVESIIAACIYIACKEHHVARTFKEICSLTKVSKKDIGKCYKLLQPIFVTRVENTESELDACVIRFSSALDLKQDVIKGTLLVSRKVTESGILAGKSPITLVAACLFFVSSLSKDPKSAKEIAGIAGCTEATLRKCLQARCDTPPSEFLADPSTPMALRLVSNLMMGTARVFEAQTCYFLTNANAVYLRVKNTYYHYQSDRLEMPLQMVNADQITIKEGVELPLELVLDVNKLKMPILVMAESSQSSLPTAPPTAKKSAIRTSVKSITLPESPNYSMIKMDEVFQDALLDDFTISDQFDNLSFQSVTGDSNTTSGPIVEAPSFMMNDLFQETFATASNKSDPIKSRSQLLDDNNLEQQHSIREETLEKKRERRMKRKTLHFDGDISLSDKDIHDLQHGAIECKNYSTSELLYVDLLNLAPIWLGPCLLSFWNSLVSVDLPTDESPEKFRAKKRKAQVTDDANVQELSLTNDDVEMQDNLVHESSSHEPEFFRNLPSDSNGLSFETPRLPWHSRAASSVSKLSSRQSVDSFSLDEVNFKKSHDGSPEKDIKDQEFFDVDPIVDYSGHVPLEKETFSFYTYLKDIAQDVDCSQIHMSDLLTDTTRKVAAQAFYHVLVLATKNVLIVSQDNVDIKIKFV